MATRSLIGRETETDTPRNRNSATAPVLSRAAHKPESVREAA